MHHVGHHLQQRLIAGGPARGQNFLRRHLHPLRMQAHRQHLRLENRAAVRGGVGGIQIKAADPRAVHPRHNLRLEPGQQDAAMIAGGRLPKPLAKRRPVGNAIQLADLLTRQRSVLETDQRHILTRG